MENIKAEWRRQNTRRIDLIEKKRDHGLNDAEQNELAHLQKDADRHIDQSKTLDFDALSEFEQKAESITCK